jgi:hypothetical protein
MATAIQALPTYIQDKVSTADVPVKYTAAVKALVACQNIDDAKYFADKSEALAAWAKIYHHDRAAVEAKRLKLHAFRRIGILANELRPGGRPVKGSYGSPPGPNSLLREHGFSGSQIKCMRTAAKIPSKQFDKMVSLPSPPAPTTLYKMDRKGSTAYKIIMNSANSNIGLSQFFGFCRKNDPKQLARGLTKSETKNRSWTNKKRNEKGKKNGNRNYRMD